MDLTNSIFPIFAAGTKEYTDHQGKAKIADAERLRDTSLLLNKLPSELTSKNSLPLACNHLQKLSNFWKLRRTKACHAVTKMTTGIQVLKEDPLKLPLTVMVITATCLATPSTILAMTFLVRKLTIFPWATTHQKVMAPQKLVVAMLVHVVLAQLTVVDQIAVAVLPSTSSRRSTGSGHSNGHHHTTTPPPLDLHHCQGNTAPPRTPPRHAVGEQQSMAQSSVFQSAFGRALASLTD